MGKWTRRALLGAGGLLGGGLVLGIAGVAFAPNRLTIKPGDSAGGGLVTWLKITPDNRVSVLVPHCDMGQGSQTALAMMLAEELEADWALVSVEEAPAEDEFANGYLLQAFLAGNLNVPKPVQRAFDFTSFKVAETVGVQTTGGSSAIRGTGNYGMRVAGAAAKEMLVAAAAARFGVAPGACVARQSRVVHEPTGQSASFGELANDAARLPIPVHPVLKARSAYTLVGTAQPRFDLPPKVIGGAVYGIDIDLPDMLHAAIAVSPVFGGTLKSVDKTPAEGMVGVVGVVELDDAVAVVADSYWHARRALAALKPEFDDGGNGAVDSASITAALETALAQGDGKKDHKIGRGAAALNDGVQQVEAFYSVPFLAHATMEPMNCTAVVRDGRCEVWAGVQDPLWARRTAARAADLKPDAVTFHTVSLGGGFGRRLPGNFDFVDQAVRIAKAMSPRPVKLVWSREDDIKHDFYRPTVIGQFRGALSADGVPVAWVSHYSGGNGREASSLPYDVAHQDIRHTDVKMHVRQGAWRSVEHSQHGFFTESFVDELAHAAGRDPFEFRRDLLAHAPRHRAVLERAALAAGWGTELAPGFGRGIALVQSFNTLVAEVAEIEVGADGALKVHRVTAAVDCGYPVNLDTATAQIEGGIIMGLSAALFEEVAIAGGAVVQDNFWDYTIARLGEAPAITVHFVDNAGPIGGIGEPGVPPIAPALANAIFAATGKRIRTLPVKNHDLTPLADRLAVNI